MELSLVDGKQEIELALLEFRELRARVREPTVILSPWK